MRRLPLVLAALLIVGLLAPVAFAGPGPGVPAPRTSSLRFVWLGPKLARATPTFRLSTDAASRRRLRQSLYQRAGSADAVTAFTTYDPRGARPANTHGQQGAENPSAVHGKCRNQVEHDHGEVREEQELEQPVGGLDAAVAPAGGGCVGPVDNGFDFGDHGVSLR